MDKFEGKSASVLDGEYITTKGYRKTPPTVHSFVDMHDEVPDTHQAIGFVYLANSNRNVLEPIKRHLVNGSLIVAKYETLREMVKEWDLELLPMFYHEDWLAVKVVA